ncbi:endonuclease/exonuclease/phosphatase family protein [Actinoplanes flavus]|uniref:Endonuclease/exonuclease/phosphatase family protein n=1 Tax=Actinoplanes flavus TaxID=2820290 RepID=A0ABS3UUD0_9ACTN|nr:endonuclease/exonuclease/phosphatase family protein [Actinoplanes flavus]MBO3742166.1 endonuclease/exonuclease/phosphatase family protein [Actinoplanes flavus]
MRVLTWNIKNGGGDRLPSIIKVIDQARPDVVTLQELQGFHRYGGRRLRELAAALDMTAHLAPSVLAQPVAVLVREPLRIVRRARISWRLHHAAAVAVVPTPAGPLTVVSAHLNPFSPYRRMREARWLAARHATPNGLTLIAGDMNGLAPPHNPNPQASAVDTNPPTPAVDTSGPAPAGVASGPSPAGVASGLDPAGVASGPSPAGVGNGPSPAGVASGPSPAGVANSLDPAGDHTAALAGLPALYRKRHLGPDGRPDTRALAAFREEGFVDLWHTVGSGDGHTVPTAYAGHEFAPVRLDYLLASPPLAARAQHLRVIRDDLTAQASDHYPLLADLDL